MRMPVPDRRILERREEFIADLGDILPPGSLLTGEDERRAYECDGLTAYRAQDWESALREFQSCLTSAPGDPVPTVFLERISLLKAQPPGSNWDGVWEFQTK